MFDSISGGKMRSLSLSKLKSVASTIKSGFQFSKWFLVLIVIFTIAYMSLQIQKNKFDKKYIVALLVMLVFSLVGVLLLILPLKGPGPYLIFYILKGLFVGGPIITFLIIEILIGQDKF